MAGLQFNKKLYKVKIVGRNLDDLRPLLRMFPVKLVDSDPDLVISYGGDGSLLGAERDFPICDRIRSVRVIRTRRRWKSCSAANCRRRSW